MSKDDMPTGFQKLCDKLSSLERSLVAIKSTLPFAVSFYCSEYVYIDTSDKIMETSNAFPFEIKDVEPKLQEELKKMFKGVSTGFVRVGPKGYLMRHNYKDVASDIYNLALRPDDVFVTSYPRSGTTWTQQLVWMVANDLDYAKSDAVPIMERFSILEYLMYLNSEIAEITREKKIDSENNLKLRELLCQPWTEKLAYAVSPRFIKAHLPLSLLPPNLLDTAKVVYVARDPRDVVVSYYHLCKLLKICEYVGDFKTFWNYFVNDTLIFAPYFEHLKEAWRLRKNPNLLFLFYEDLSKDLPVAVRRVANFFNKDFTEDQVAGLCEQLRFDNFKKNKSVNHEVMKELGLHVSSEEAFIRKGKVGGWREYFDEEMTQQTERWIADNLRDTDLRFPHLEN